MKEWEYIVLQFGFVCWKKYNLKCHDRSQLIKWVIFPFGLTVY